MLLQFSVENFLSIKDKVTLSMVASKDKSLEDTIINFNKINLLKSAAIYGSNASGKTNILRAISFIIRQIRTSHLYQPDDFIQITPFRLDAAYKDKPSKFEIIFTVDDIKYIYGVALDQIRVYEEYLYYYPKGRMSIIFDRTNVDEYKFTKDVGRQKDIAVNTPDNTLYISKSANLNYELTSKVVKHLGEAIIIIEQDIYLKFSSGIYTKKALMKNTDIKNDIINLVKKADNGIMALNVTKRDLSDDFAKGWPQDVRDLLIDEESHVVKTTHIGLDASGEQIKVDFNLSDEAGGTQKMFNIAGQFIDVLSKGKLLIMDELETSLHPELIRNLLKIFNSSKYNRNGAQLIFTTHSTALLRQDTLRRDQIWFTEKKSDQSTDLRSAFEYKARKGENIEKGYLSGRYGAIPILD